MRKLIGVAMAIGSVLCMGAAADSDWISKVPARQQLQTNPMAQDSSSVEAGKRLFLENCASCHGAVGEGIGKHPSLVSTKVHNATDGDLAWLLQNGNLRK